MYADDSTFGSQLEIMYNIEIMGLIKSHCIIKLSYPSVV